MTLGSDAAGSSSKNRAAPTRRMSSESGAPGISPRRMSNESAPSRRMSSELVPPGGPSRRMSSESHQSISIEQGRRNLINYLAAHSIDSNLPVGSADDMIGRRSSQESVLSGLSSVSGDWGRNASNNSNHSAGAALRGNSPRPVCNRPGHAASVSRRTSAGSLSSAALGWEAQLAQR